MRKRPVLTVLLAALLALGAASPAGAAPVVDQYTEQIPTPGGPEPLVPGNPNGNGGSGGEGSAGQTADSPGVVAGGGSYITEDGQVIPIGSGDQGGTGGSGSGQAGNGSSGNSQASSDGLVTSTGGDGDGGMGWLFPVALLLVAAVAVGAAFSRRNRNNPAT